MIFVAKYKVAFGILTVSSYDLVVLPLIDETRRKGISKNFSASSTINIQG